MKRTTENTFSIIICAKNEEQYIDKKITNSLKIQGNIIEIIVVDDNSQDQTAKITKKWQEKNIRIKYIKNKQEKGKIGALRTGVKSAQGRWLILTDCDTILDLQVITKIEKLLADNKLWIVGLQAKNRTWEWTVIENCRLKLWPTWLTRGQFMLVRNKKELFEEFDYVDDVEIAWKAIKLKKKVLVDKNSYFVDNFAAGWNFYRQIWRRSLFLDKAIYNNIEFLLNNNYFSNLQIIKNSFFVLEYFIGPWIGLILLFCCIYLFPWTGLLLLIFFSRIFSIMVVLAGTSIYAGLTIKKKNNFDW